MEISNDLETGLECSHMGLQMGACTFFVLDMLFCSLVLEKNRSEPRLYINGLLKKTCLENIVNHTWGSTSTFGLVLDLILCMY